MSPKKEILLIALGGNALIHKGQEGTIDQQFDNLKVPMRQVAQLACKYRILITHGNGPQVGNLLLQQECCSTLPRLPLEILVAQTQGQIGYMIESTLDSELMALGIHSSQKIITTLSYVIVDPDDPAFQTPSKPIGPVFTAEQASRLPYPTVQTAKGYRRVVVSPKPSSIVEKREIAQLIDMGFIVICCGGGGIPVVRAGRRFCGVDAVIDKDLASARLALEVGVDRFVIATDVPGAALDHGTPHERFLNRLTVTQAERYMAEGHFPPGSMGPKIEACVFFAHHCQKRAYITDLAHIEAALNGHAGTRINP